MSNNTGHQVVNRYNAAVARRYTHKGKENTEWIYIGEMTEWSNGDKNMVLKCLPTFPDWDGKVHFFVPKAREEAPRPAVAAEEVPF